jgi:hypothetical protein
MIITNQWKSTAFALRAFDMLPDPGITLITSLTFRGETDYKVATVGKNMDKPAPVNRRPQTICAASRHPID